MLFQRNVWWYVLGNVGSVNRSALNRIFWMCFLSLYGIRTGVWWIHLRIFIFWRNFLFHGLLLSHSTIARILIGVITIYNLCITSVTLAVQPAPCLTSPYRRPVTMPVKAIPKGKTAIKSDRQLLPIRVALTLAQHRQLPSASPSEWQSFLRQNDVGFHAAG